MFVFDFLKKVFGWADEGSRKRRADSFSFEKEYVSLKKHRCDFKTAHSREEIHETDDDSDSDDIEITAVHKYTPMNSCHKLNGSQRGRGSSYAFRKAPPHSSASKPSFSQQSREKFDMVYLENKSPNTSRGSIEYKCPTLSKTHRLREKNQYVELLQNFLPHRIHVLSNRQEPSRVQKTPEVIELDNSKPSSSTCKSQQTSKMPEIISRFNWLPRNRIPKEKERFSTPNLSMKEKPVNSIQNKICAHKKVPVPVVEKSPDVTYIETIQTNTLRDKLAAKTVIREDFIPQVAKRYNERIEQRFKEAEELKKMTCVLSKHNQLAREAALEERLARSMRLAEAVYDDREEPEELPLPTLTDEMLNEIKSALVPRPPDAVLVEGFGLRITRKDIHTLADLNWLNDEVINFYMNLLIARSAEGDKFPKIHAMNTFFYPKLISSGHSSLKRWTRKIDIFAQDIIVVPIHLGIHWCMSIIDFRDKSIRYYDSMGGSNPKCLSALRQYLEDESLDKKKKTFDTGDWKLESVTNIPQQMNGSDCGVFSCMFAEYICANRKLTFTQQDMPYFRNKMVYEILKAKLL